jgi:hypothetical protein
MRRGYVRLARVAVCVGVFVGLVGAQRTMRSESVLVSQWGLDEGAGSTTTDSAGNEIGTLQNGASWTQGHSGAAVNMDGVNDYISVSNLRVSGPVISLTAWVKNSSLASGIDQSFISKADDATEDSTYWMLGLTSAGQNRLRFRLSAGGVTTTLTASGGDLPLNSWYHVAATYDGGMMRLYLNGKEVDSIAKSGSIPGGGSVPIDIGRSADGSNYLRGTIDDVRIYRSALDATEIAALVRGDEGGASANQPPNVSLTAPASGAVFKALASITLSATASDVDGTIARVDFYSGSTLLGSDTSSPHSFAWNNVLVGNYSLTAVARDNAGATTVSSTRGITVTPATLPSTTVFTPSSNHATAVDRYVLEVFPLGADTTLANPVGTQDLGKPAINNGECRADISATILALTPGTYVVTITAIGEGGSTQSAPSPQFTR